jgi:hypothetical protein
VDSTYLVVFSPYYRKVKGERSMWLVEDRTASKDLTVVIETAVCVCLSVMRFCFPGNFKGCMSWGLSQGVFTLPVCILTRERQIRLCSGLNCVMMRTDVQGLMRFPVIETLYTKVAKTLCIETCM